MNPPAMHLADNQFIDAATAVSCRSSTPLGGLFHSPGFFRLHAPVGAGNAHFFEWCKGTQVLGSVHFRRDDQGLWRNPARGTFAGYATRGLELEGLMDFHAAVENRLQQHGGCGMEILLPPQAHGTVAVAQQIYALRARGLSISRCDLNQSLEVSAVPLSERMSYGNRKRLNKCQREGHEARQVGLDALSEVYACIASNRAAKGYPMSMSLNALQDMATALPDSLVLFECRQNGRVSASAVCLRLDAQTLYVFYWGDAPGQSTHSPVVMVAEAIYTHCQREGVRLLDVGTSTIDTEPHFGLLHFKQGLGMAESLKFRMEKRW